MAGEISLLVHWISGQVVPWEEKVKAGGGGGGGGGGDV